MQSPLNATRAEINLGHFFFTFSIYRPTKHLRLAWSSYYYFRQTRIVLLLDYYLVNPVQTYTFIMGL